MLTDVTSMDSQFKRLERGAALAADWIKDLIFPPTCGNCGRVDYRFCASCLRELEQVAIAVSPGTREDLTELDALIASGAHRGVLQNAVQAFKYEGARQLATPLAHRLVKALRSADWRIDAVAPVPLFADREAERGYNQSALLSQQVVAATGFKHCVGCLKRNRDTGQQARLSQADRRLNVRDAFEASDDVKGLSILLVDDVITTGSTLRECALALRGKGAGAVFGIAVSHAQSQ